MEVAEHDRVVWTDDDFAHPGDWLATLNADYERQGPTTEIPVFVGTDPLARLFEPAYAIGGTGAVFAGGIVWGRGRLRARRSSGRTRRVPRRPPSDRQRRTGPSRSTST